MIFLDPQVARYLQDQLLVLAARATQPVTRQYVITLACRPGSPQLLIETPGRFGRIACQTVPLSAADLCWLMVRSAQLIGIGPEVFDFTPPMPAKEVLVDSIQRRLQRPQ